ncbi:MAG: translation initiation factor IF-3 [Candidatus Paceibacterota bacterium]
MIGNKQYYTRTRINKQIRARELRIIDESGGNLGVLLLEEALKKAEERGLDLIEISPSAKPPVAKIADFGRYQYEENKKKKKAGGKTTETKTLQVKIATGEHDLELKAKKASKFLKEGHRVKIDLFLAGRAKYLEKNFLEERLDRILHLISEGYKVADGPKKSPKGLTVVVEKQSKKALDTTETMPVEEKSSKKQK